MRNPHIYNAKDTGKLEALSNYYKCVRHLKEIGKAKTNQMPSLLLVLWKTRNWELRPIKKKEKKIGNSVALVSKM